jgi:hypothetical protein
MPLLAELVAELKTLSPAIRSEWALNRSREAVDLEQGPPVRFPLFREVLFAELLEGMRKEKPGCARWLEGFYPLLYKSPDCMGQLEEYENSSLNLLRLALQADRNDSRSRSKLIFLLAREFAYSLHELPAGVLFGRTWASIEQCRKLVLLLGEFEGHVSAEGRELEFAELVARCRYHFSEYPKYLEQIESYESYAHFLGER